jgi:hypothetical protein
MASDGKWYPPELWTGPPNTGPAGATGQPSGQQPQPTQQQPTQPAYPIQAPGYGGGTAVPPGPPAYGAAPYANAGYGQYAPQGQAAYGQPVKRKTNGLAIASLICSCAGVFVLGIPAILGIIFGFVARGQIRRSNGAQSGEGLALAGIIVGFVVAAIVIVVFVVSATNGNQSNAVVSLVTAFR